MCDSVLLKYRAFEKTEEAKLVVRLISTKSRQSMNNVQSVNLSTKTRTSIKNLKVSSEIFIFCCF